MKRTFGTLLASALVVTTVGTSLAEVEFTSIRRDVSTFAQLEVPGEEGIFESDDQFDLELGVFNTNSTSLADAASGFVSGIANQASLVDPATGIQAEGFIFSQAITEFPAGGQGLGSTRIFGTFVVEETIPVDVNAFLDTEGDGRASLSIIGADLIYYEFISDATVTLDEVLVLEPGTYDFSFVALGFGTSFDEEDERASVSFVVDIGFGSAADVDPPLSAAGAIELYPNPARSEMSLVLPSPTGAPSDITVFDTSGREVRRLQATTGQTQLTWDLRDASGLSVPSGVYYVKLSRQQPVRAIVIR